jgi:hypothetical protein
MAEKHYQRRMDDLLDPLDRERAKRIDEQENNRRATRRDERKADAKRADKKRRKLWGR